MAIPKTYRKKLGTLSASAQTLRFTFPRVSGRRIRKIHLEARIANANPAPTYETNQTWLDLFGEVRVFASDYARPTQATVRKATGNDLFLWEQQMDVGQGADDHMLRIQTGANSGTYTPGIFVYFAHPNLEDAVGLKGCLPQNAPVPGRTGEMAAFVNEEVVLEIDVPASATVYNANAPTSVTFYMTVHEVWMPDDAPYIATDLTTTLYTWPAAGGTLAPNLELPNNGWMLDVLMQWFVGGARSNNFLTSADDVFRFVRGTSPLEEWTRSALEAHNARGRGRYPSVLASATTLPNVNPPAGVIMRDFLFKEPNAYAYVVDHVQSLYPVNKGDVVQIEATSLAASTTTRLTLHRAFVSNINRLVAIG